MTLQQKPIPQTRPDITDAEEQAILACLRSGSLAGGGPWTERVVTMLRESLGVADVILTTSGTDALELVSLALGVEHGDTVVLPSFTFSSAATAFIRSGAQVRFVDIDRQTLGMDPDSLAGNMDATVRAVVPVHYAGVPCDLHGIEKVIERWPRAVLIEDNAHGLYGTLRGRPLGTFGPLGTTSFHATKNLTSGEGGAVLINDPSFADRAHVLAEKGTDRTAFTNGLVDKYTWRDTGSSFILAEPLAAMLEAQLMRRESLFESRRRLAKTYLDALAGFSTRYGIELPLPLTQPGVIPHLFHLIMPSNGIRDIVLKEMNAKGIGAAFHYIPLHDAPASTMFSTSQGHCPISTDIAGRMLRLPFHSSMGEDDIEAVVSALTLSLERHV